MEEKRGTGMSGTTGVGRTMEEQRVELAQFLNRIIMFEQEAIGILAPLARDEKRLDVRDRIEAIADENRRAIELAERAIRELGEKPSVARKTAGALAAGTRFLVESLPARAREAVKARDIKRVAESAGGPRFVDWTDAYVAEVVAHAHWRLLKRIADEASVVTESARRALRDAASESEPTAEAHASYFEAKAEEEARRNFAMVGALP